MKPKNEDSPGNKSSSTARRVQMIEIARAAGVSVSTVSRALAGSKLISANTRARIGEFARLMNQDRNPETIFHAPRRNETISVVLPLDFHCRQDASDPFFLSLLGSIADAVAQHGCEMLFSRVDVDRLDKAADAYDAGRSLGVLVIGQWHHHDQLNKLALRGIPMVVWGARLPGQLYCSVGSDNLQGGLAVTRHLLTRGCNRILFVGDTSLPEVACRYEGHLQGLLERRWQQDADLVVNAPFCVDLARPIIRARCAQSIDFDGVFAASDLLALTVIQELHLRGVRVPRDVLVAGYDDVELSRFVSPSITTVQQSIPKAGHAMVRALFDLSQGRPMPSVLLPTELFARDSTHVHV